MTMSEYMDGTHTILHLKQNTEIAANLFFKATYVLQVARQRPNSREDQAKRAHHKHRNYRIESKPKSVHLIACTVYSSIELL